MKIVIGTSNALQQGSGQSLKLGKQPLVNDNIEDNPRLQVPFTSA